MFYNAVKEAIGNPDYLLAGDVYVKVTWLMHERVRYQTNRVADLDNTLKVLIDALTGPEGILVDDTQIQAIHYEWIDWARQEEETRIELHFSIYDWFPKKGLYFVRFSGGLCWPSFNILSPAAELKILNSLEDRLKLREAHGYEFYRYIASIQRPFHASYLRKFQVEDLASAKQRLQAENMMGK